MNKRILLVAVLAVVVAAAAWLGFFRSGTIQSTSEVGQKAADFQAVDFSNQSVSLSQFAGKPVFLDFWAAWCPPCSLEVPEIEKIHKEFGDRVVVLGIHRTATEPKKKGEELAQKHNVTYRLLQDPDDRIYKTFTGGRDFMPYAVYIGKDGIIRHVKAGGKTAEEMRAQVEQLLK